ncbi:TPA: ABC transporter ATP-binding protein, partial [Escherichia coli]
AKRIIVMDNGIISEDGTHKELISKKDSLYAYLYHLQA